MMLRRIDRVDAAACRSGVLEVWQAVFGPVGDVGQWTSEVWDRHRGRGGYRLVTADEGDRMVGFAWGYTGDHGQFFSDRVTAALGPTADDWVGGHFEFVELAVLPDVRRRGVGAGLHDLLLEGLTHDRALLSTSADIADPAVRLYAARGWRRIGLLDPGTQVMGVRDPGIHTT